MTYEEEFIKHRKSFKVAPYALADVIEALSNDSEYHTDICVTKEDDHLVVFFYRRFKGCVVSLNNTATTNIENNLKLNKGK